MRDTFLYFIRSDTFHVISIANSANLYELGSCVESGSVTTGSGNTVVVCQGTGFAFVDVSNPASPHEVSTYLCGNGRAATARGNLVCASYEEAGYPYPVRFITLDISTPSSPRLLAKLNGLGGYDIFLDGPLAFVSGRAVGVENPQPFQILSIADSAHPAFIDSLRTTNDGNWGVWENASLERAFVADEYDGLAVVDIHNLNNPVLKTWVLKTGSSVDLSIDGQYCYVASLGVGLRLLDVSDPTKPKCISGIDSAFVDEPSYTVTARDSFAYTNLSSGFCAISVADPFKPQKVAVCTLFNWAQRVVLRDSFVYCAEENQFQVVNIARPRAPVVVGACTLPDFMYGMDISDTLAFIANGVDGLKIIDVARPDSPEVVGEFVPPNGACGVAVIDTFAYLPSGNLYVASVASPTSPYLIDSVVVPTFGWSVAASDSVLFVGNRDVYGMGNDIRLFDIRNPVRPMLVGSLAAPYWVKRLAWVAPYLYAACGDAGVLIAETAAVGVQEPRGVVGTWRRLRVVPNPVADMVRIDIGEPLGVGSRLDLYDVSGRRVLVRQIGKEAVSVDLKLSSLSPGLYFLRVETKTRVLGSKLIKQ
jgi:hypothetical protein